MKPTTFKNVNAGRGGGPKADFGTAEDVADLPVYRGDDGEEISRWQPSLLDRLRLAFGGSVWVRIWGANHPPLSVEARYPFV